MSGCWDEIVSAPPRLNMQELAVASPRPIILIVLPRKQLPFDNFVKIFLLT